jgi:MarR family transcriptional regulator, transcriptional regulator for hemolysin
MRHREQTQRTVGFVLHDVARLLRKRFEQRAREANLPLTRAQWSVLAHLSLHEGINQAGLAQILEIEPITLVRLLDKLEASGLVERRPDPTDRRARALFLTAKAHPLLERIRNLGAEVRQDAMAGLSHEDQDRFMATLLTMKGNLSQQVAEPCEEARSERAYG